MTCPLIFKNGATRLMVKLNPGASANRLMGGDLDLFGDYTLKVMVTAIPENGEANAALFKLLSKVLDVPKSAIRIESGATNRVKILSIDSTPEHIWQRIQENLG